MIKLKPYEVCPLETVCDHRDDFRDLGVPKCEGANPDRGCVFVCEFLEKCSAPKYKKLFRLKSYRSVRR